MAAGRDHYILFSVCAEAVSHWGGVRSGRQLCLPQFLAGLDVEGAQEGIKSSSNKNQSSRGNDRTTQVDRSRRDKRLFAAKVLHRTQRSLPANLAFGHVHCGQLTPGRRGTRQVRRRLQESAKQSVRRSDLRRIVAIFGADFILPEIRASDQLRFGNQIVGVDHQQAVLWIKRVAAPGHASYISRHDQSSLSTRRGKNTFVAKSANPVAAGLAILRRRTPCVFRRHFLRSERRRSNRERLSGRRVFAWNIALRS